MNRHKNTRADIEQYRVLFFAVGLVVSLSLVIFFFEFEFRVGPQVRLRAKVAHFENDLLELLPEKIATNQRKERRKDHPPNSRPVQAPTTHQVTEAEVPVPERLVRSGIHGKVGKPSELSGVPDHGEDKKDQEAGGLFGYIEYMKIPAAEHLAKGVPAEIVYVPEVDNLIKVEVREKRGYTHHLQKSFPRLYHTIGGQLYVDPMMQELIRDGFTYRLHYHQRTMMVRVHTHFAVNVHQIAHIDEHEIVLESGERIPVEDRYRKLLSRKIKEYARKEIYRNDSIQEIFTDRLLIAADNVRYASRKQAVAIGPRTGRNGSGYAEITVASIDDGSASGITASLAKANRKLAFDRYNQVILPKAFSRKPERPSDWHIDRPYGMADNTIRVDHTLRSMGNVAAILAGRVAGVQVIGDDVFIRSRPDYKCPVHHESRSTHPARCPVQNCNMKMVPGSGSGFGSSGGGPLYLLNGVPVSKEVIMAFPVQSIAAIDVLKSPQTTSFYGARGGGGVIAVYTRIE